MKNKYRILYFLTFSPIVFVLITLPFFPDTIPAHYDMAGNINRWGSKYELLILPVMILAFLFFMLAITKSTLKKEDTSSANEKVLLITTYIFILVFNILNLLFMYKAYFLSTGKEEPVDIDITQLIFIIMGISFCIIGSAMPKCKMNSLVGLRTKWSIANQKIWTICQRYGGRILIIGGIIIAIVNLFLTGSDCIIFFMIAMIMILVPSILTSYLVYKRNI
jgi:uncharacterized membrane protein